MAGWRKSRHRHLGSEASEVGARPAMPSQAPRPLLRVEWRPWRVLRKDTTISDSLRAPLASRGWLGAETGRGLRRPPRGWRGRTRELRGRGSVVSSGRGFEGGGHRSSGHTEWVLHGVRPRGLFLPLHSRAGFRGGPAALELGGGGFLGSTCRFASPAVPLGARAGTG